MTKNQRLLAVPITIITFSALNLITAVSQAAPNVTGTKGAQIYCYLRESGNEHEVSWQSAYEVIKRQSNSLFKTSPKHGAVMILEAVVQNPNIYQICGSFLGDLFGNTNLNGEESLLQSTDANKTTKSSYSPNQTQKDRYSY